MEYELELGVDDVAFRDEVRRFLDEHLPDGWGTPGFKPWADEASRIVLLKDWQRRLAAARLVAIGWPIEHGGRGATLVQQLVLQQEMSARKAPAVIGQYSIAHAGPTIIQWGTEEQRKRFLPPMLSAEEFWCQGFSEPDAGSDLAALKTRAVRDGDDFIVNGQKIWTTLAHVADWCYMLVRTDPDAPKHAGITCLLVDMRSPGITVRPLKQISGESEFNEVFFDDVRVPVSQAVGPINEGWRVATTTLAYERAGGGRPADLERRLEILVALASSMTVDGEPAIDDPRIQERLAEYASLVEAMNRFHQTSLLARLRGTAPGPESAMMKLLVSEAGKHMTEMGFEIAGANGVLEKGSRFAIKGGNIPLSYLIMRAATIGGGTSEMQRNVIGERLLGLPRG